MMIARFETDPIFSVMSISKKVENFLSVHFLLTSLFSFSKAMLFYELFFALFFKFSLLVYFISHDLTVLENKNSKL